MAELAVLDSLEDKQKSLEDALAEGREIAKRSDLNDEERADLVKRVEMITGLKSEVAQDLAIKAALEEHAGPADVEILTQRGLLQGKSLGEAFLESDEYKSWDKAGFRSDLDAYEWQAVVGDVYGTKAEPTVVDETTALPNAVVAQRINTIQPLVAHRLSVADLIPQIRTSGNAVTYYQEATVTHSIAGVAEGAEKPNFTLTGAMKTEELEVIAGFGAVTKQTLRDLPFMAAFINNRMTYKLKEVEEQQLLLGNGSSPQIDGLYNRVTGELTQAGESLIDSIYIASDMCYEDGGFAATGVVIKPADWRPIALAKDANDRYYGTGPFASAIGDTIWGLNVIKSRQNPAGRALVGAFDQAFIVRNGGLTVRTSEHHSDYFKKNKIAILVEEDIALGVYSPLAFVDLLIG